MLRLFIQKSELDYLLGLFLNPVELLVEASVNRCF